MTIKEAKDAIIKRSINSAVYIDDEVAEPYSGEENDAIKSAKDMYQSFRKEGLCDLDVYKFTNFDDFKDNKEWLLNHKNLLILDWELSQNTEIKFEDSLSILGDFVDKHSVNFIVIYTKVAEPISVIRQIKCAFSGLDNYRESFREDLTHIIENSDTDKNSDEIWSDIIKFFEENYQKTPNELKTTLREFFDKEQIDCTKDIVPLRDKYHMNVSKLMLYLEVAALAIYKNRYKQVVCKITGEDSLLLDGIPVFIIPKNGEISPNALYANILKRIENIPNSCSMLLSLYFRNVVLQKTSKVGQGLNNICDSTLMRFVARYKELEDKEQVIPENKPALHSFLQECIMGEVSSLISSNEEDIITPILWGQVPEHDEDKNEDVKLNSFLSFIPEERLRNQKRQISTGDIFEKMENGERSGYLMCITQGCDCVRPYKIDYNYAFAIGNSINAISALSGAEEKYCTYLPDGKTCIEWVRKFYTIHLEKENKRIFNTQEPIKINDTTSLQYLGTQKDYYAQRVINYVFNYALRMGADLVTHEKESKPDCNFYKSESCYYKDEKKEAKKTSDAKVSIAELPIKNEI